MSSPEQILSQEILDLVNKARVVLGMSPLRRLPRGVPDAARKCVLGRSLGLEVLLDDQNRAYALLLHYRAACSVARVWGAARPYGMWNGWAVLLPGKLDEFVHEFDSRCHPSMESPHCDDRQRLQSDLRHLRFDWNDQHGRITALLERAKSASDNADRVRQVRPDQAETPLQRS